MKLKKFIEISQDESFDQESEVNYIEQEKLYTVEIPNPNSAGGKLVLFKHQSTGRLILEMLNPIINKPKYLHLTESEIKQDFEFLWKFAKEVE